MASHWCDRCGKIFMSQAQLAHHKTNAQRLCIAKGRKGAWQQS